MGNNLEAPDIAKRFAEGKNVELLERQIMLYVGRKVQEQPFERTFNELALRVHGMAVEKGWWEEDRNDGEMIALMHSELSEGLEALRHGNPESDHIPEFTGIEEELADVVVRIMDMAGARGYNVGGAITAKIAFNATRPQKHGGKRF